MKQSAMKGLILALSFLGIVDAWYLAESAISDTPLVCGVGGSLDGCNVVAQSVYSHLFGIPLGVYGVVFYTLVFVLAALSLYHPRFAKNLWLFLLGVLGIAASAIFEGIQIFLIKAICIYCLGSAVISILIFITALMLWKATRVPSSVLPVDAVVS